MKIKVTHYQLGEKIQIIKNFQQNHPYGVIVCANPKELSTYRVQRQMTVYGMNQAQSIPDTAHMLLCFDPVNDSQQNTQTFLSILPSKGVDTLYVLTPQMQPPTNDVTFIETLSQWIQGTSHAEFEE